MVDWISAKQFHDEPDNDLRPEAVVVRTAASPGGRLDATDTELVRRVSAIAGDLDLAPDPSRLHTIQIAIAEAEGVPTQDFWIAALGYQSIEELIVDPLRRGPRMWSDEISAPGRGRTHIDVAVPNDRAEARVASIQAAGGRLADDSHVPDWWTMASPTITASTSRRGAMWMTMRDVPRRRWSRPGR